MKPTRADVQSRGYLPGDKVAMTFDESARQHLMAIMTDLYSDPELAIIREYSTNALDSHIEAGNSSPIQVTTPSGLAPFLVIEDHGIGLSVDDIHEIYSKYGASTKRGTNDAVGMLGLGCKSALTYTTQFTLTAVKDGVRTQVAISRDEDGGGTMTIVDTASTDAQNGVKIVIPAKHVNSLQRKAEEFFRFWAPGTVLLNGLAPKHIEGLPLSPTMTLLARENTYGSSRESYVVMGNVAYPVQEQRFNHLPYGHGLVAVVPIGAVHFTPSREALHYTPQTIKALEHINEQVPGFLSDAVQKEIDRAPSRAEALEVFLKWKNIGVGKTRTFTRKGETLPNSLSAPQAPDGTRQGRLMVTSKGSGYGMSKAQPVVAADLSYFTNSLFITGYEPETFTANHKHKLNKYAADNQATMPPQLRSYVLLDFPLPTEVAKWIPKEQIVPWETIKAIKLPKATPAYAGARIPGSYDVYMTSGLAKEYYAKAKPGQHVRQWIDGIPGDSIDQSKPLFWEHGNQNNVHHATVTLAEFHPEFTIVCLPENRIAKFQRDVPKAVRTSDETKRLMEEWLKKLTPRQVAALSMSLDSYAKRTFSRLAKWRPKIADPALRETIDVASYDATKLSKNLSRFGREARNRIPAFVDPLDRYPLFNGDFDQHTIDYLNWHYKTRLGLTDSSGSAKV